MIGGYPFDRSDSVHCQGDELVAVVVVGQHSMEAADTLDTDGRVVSADRVGVVAVRVELDCEVENSYC